ncbi:DUF397 domain-containing protein [Streptomyces ureilyticus]|uniref:DUF397 domain-containing protein n=1 Tax=Streptomyces ureilyticus TaxID=1775131 RepID=A0ABX0DN52_9ACTN|nr:DUF397 domain-containing protein [Streptomyces ureilyticus]NGO43281.1 DUF397 domain-containing protein [Streptomyces ureilyticus]
MNAAARPRKISDDLAWFKSSYSSNEGGDCLEVAYAWRKSSYSSDEGGNCVEVATHPSAVHIRDSKNPTGPVLTVAPASWAAFVSGGPGVN